MISDYLTKLTVAERTRRVISIRDGKIESDKAA